MPLLTPVQRNGQTRNQDARVVGPHTEGQVGLAAGSSSWPYALRALSVWPFHLWELKQGGMRQGAPTARPASPSAEEPSPRASWFQLSGHFVTPGFTLQRGCPVICTFFRSGVFSGHSLRVGPTYGCRSPEKSSRKVSWISKRQNDHFCMRRFAGSVDEGRVAGSARVYAATCSTLLCLRSSQLLRELSSQSSAAEASGRRRRCVENRSSVLRRVCGEFALSGLCSRPGPPLWCGARFKFLRWAK